jgi:hypothetical protein
VVKADSSVAVTGPTTFNYNGAGQGPANANVIGSSGPVSYSYSGAGYGPSTDVPTDAGSYTVTATVAADSNYNGASSSAASFTISAKAASVTADAKSKTYGDVNPGLTATEAGTVNGDTLSYSLATDATQFSGVGVSNIVVTLGNNPNYSVSATNSILTINAASLSITASNASKPYGQTVTFTGTEFFSSGLVGSDSVSSVTLNSSGAVSPARPRVLAWPITISTIPMEHWSSVKRTLSSGRHPLKTRPATRTQCPSLPRCQLTPVAPWCSFLQTVRSARTV